MTPDIAADGTKEFTLTAELHDWAPVNGVLTTAWTFNGQVPGPTIRVTEGDHVRIHFINRLPEPSTVHWHGILLPNEMDGVPGLTQDAVQPGGSFDYEFTASHAGTFMYHSHYDDMKQIGSGMYGAFIIDPKATAVPAGTGDLTAQTKYDHDYTMLLSGFHVNTAMEEEQDYFTINGVSYPDTPPLDVKKGDTVRIRLINIDTMEPHTMHLHGMDFALVARNGSPLKSVETMNTVLIGPGETADIALRAEAIGKWVFHCHILDHTMNGGDMSTGEMGGLISLLNVTE
nr:multicopper oxidase domain-containing protein [Paenibacillus caui]